MSDTISTVARDELARRHRTRGKLHPLVLRWLLISGGVLVVAIGALAYWLSGGRWQDTDDAYVQADTVTIAPKVSGYLVEVLVQDNETVKAGQVLARIDDRDLSYRFPV